MEENYSKDKTGPLVALRKQIGTLPRGISVGRPSQGSLGQPRNGEGNPGASPQQKDELH